MSVTVNPKVGVIFKSYEPLSSMQKYAAQSEASGMSGGFWIAEAYHWFRKYGLESRGCFTTLAAVAMATKKIPVGLGITSPYMRHPTIQANEAAGEDPDFGVTMGLFSYPVLMAADILMFNAARIPVGRDQIQHVEMARDIAQRFNHIYAPLFTLPEAVVDDSVAVLQGLDGRKMSKSYRNTIPLFAESRQLRKSINQIKTNLLEPGEPAEPSRRLPRRAGRRSGQAVDLLDPVDEAA